MTEYNTPQLVESKYIVVISCTAQFGKMFSDGPSSNPSKYCLAKKKETFKPPFVEFLNTFVFISKYMYHMCQGLILMQGIIIIKNLYG